MIWWSESFSVKRVQGACILLIKSLTVSYVQGARNCEPSAQDQDVRADVHLIKSLTVNFGQGARYCVTPAQDQDVRADVHLIKSLTVNYHVQGASPRSRLQSWRSLTKSLTANCREQEKVVHHPKIKTSELTWRPLTKSLTANNVQGARDCGPSAQDQDVRADVGLPGRRGARGEGGRQGQGARWHRCAH